MLQRKMELLENSCFDEAFEQKSSPLFPVLCMRNKRRYADMSSGGVKQKQSMPKQGLSKRKMIKLSSLCDEFNSVDGEVLQTVMTALQETAYFLFMIVPRVQDMSHNMLKWLMP